jgi:hypothetical protein
VPGFHACDAFLESHEKRKDYLKQHGHNIKWIQYGHSCLYRRRDDDGGEVAALDIAEHCPNLRCLISEQQLGAEVVLKIIQTCPLLEELSIYGRDCKNNVVLELARKSSMRKVELIHMDVREELLVALVRSNRGLRCLNVSASGVATTFVRELALSCPELTDLVLHKFSADQTEWWCLLAQCRQLRSLRTYGCIWRPSPLPSGPPAVFDHVRSITIESSEFTVSQLRHLVRACPGLTNLCLHYCNTLADLTAFPFGTYCPSLQELALYDNYDYVGDAALYNIAERCPDLRRLHIPRSCEATDAGLTAVLRRCPLLNYLHIGSCSELTRGVLTVMADCAQSLTTVDVTCCERITKRDAAALMKRCPRIKVTKNL